MAFAATDHQTWILLTDLDHITPRFYLKRIHDIHAGLLTRANRGYGKCPRRSSSMVAPI
jgi:hypothetical protein